MNDFETTLYEMAKEAILSVDSSTASDVYAVSFFIYDEEDDPRCPTLRIGYNTKARWQECSPKPGQTPRWPVASDSNEAKWNYAFWLQNSLCTIGVSGTVAAASREKWIKAQSLWRTDEEEEANPEEFDDAGEQITAVFVRVCIQAAQQLHAQGILSAALGRSVPIIIHELEYYSEIAEQTQKANPPGLANEFNSWVMSFY
jgi:hypothetical protein